MAEAVTVQQGLESINVKGLFGAVAMQENREGNIYFEDNQHLTFIAVKLTWSGSVYIEKQYKNGNITYKETKSSCNMVLQSIQSGETIMLQVECSEKIFTERCKCMRRI